VLYWIPFAVIDVLFDIHPEGENHINDDGRACGNERKVNKPHADTGRCYPHFIAQSRANSKGV